MSASRGFETGDCWWPEERSALAAMNTPWKIQQFLDSIPYNSDHETRSPRRVLRDRKAHCFEGALFAAAALRFHGHPPILLDLRAHNDDDHVIAIYRVRGHIGALAKSNFSGIRFREAIHRTFRELALSYFDQYFNTVGERSLRSYSRAFDLSVLDCRGWMTSEEDVSYVGDCLDRLRHYPLLDDGMVCGLSPVDERLYNAGFLGTDMAGAYKAKPPDSAVLGESGRKEITLP